ncbi:hypothetical protein BRN98_12215, partial [Xanthomonas oryzae pv. oryzae]
MPAPGCTPSRTPSRITAHALGCRASSALSVWSHVPTCHCQHRSAQRGWGACASARRLRATCCAVAP